MIVCGTGHRPDKRGGYGPDVAGKLIALARSWLEPFVDIGVDKVISGGALGWDQALADAALWLNIPVELYLPFPGFEDRWPTESKLHLYSQMPQVLGVHYICGPGYAGWKMQERNKAMVDDADKVLALWNGSTGGTGNCIAYANKAGKPIVNLWEIYNGKA